MKGKKVGIIFFLIFVMCICVFGGIYVTRNIGKSSKVISEENAQSRLAKMAKKVNPKEAEPVKSAIEYDANIDEAQELPDIDTCEITTPATTDFYAEIYSSPEKADTGLDGWLCEMAKEFNKKGVMIDGQKASIQIRKVNSGQAMDYIATGKAVPDGFSPSSMFWVDMLNAKGVATETITKSMVGNVAGILLTEDAYKKIMDKYGNIDFKSITEAVEAGEINMGYTNPFPSTAGLNYLMCTLQRYDIKNPLSETAVAGFKSFQSNITFVALTTMQLREAADKGVLDGLIMEYQSYVNNKNLSKNYKFIPYGYRHDNPLVTVKSASKEKKELLQKFAEFCASKSAQKRATEYGFNGYTDYKCEYPDITGETLLSAQKLYKTNKDSNRPVVAVFVADVSGSMGGDKIAKLQDSLINSMRYINTTNYIGLVSYNHDVTIELPIKQFDIEQQTYFKGAVENLYTSGETATYDGIIVGMDMIQKAIKDIPNARPMIFVLSDGQTISGHSLRDIKDIMTGLKIPVYTIGYGEDADKDALEKISSINEAESLDASTDDVIYQLKSLFNANM